MKKIRRGSMFGKEDKMVSNSMKRIKEESIKDLFGKKKEISLDNLKGFNEKKDDKERL